MSDNSGRLLLMKEESTEAAGIRIVRHAMDDAPLLILFKLKNNKVDYSLMNRPEPNLTEVRDAVLMSALIGAGRDFKFKRVKSIAARERVNRDDGRDVTYKESMEIDWEQKRIRSSRGRALSLNVLSIVVQNLAASAAREAAPKADKDLN